MQLGDEHPFRFLIHDRDTKFSNALDEILRTEGIKVIRTPVKAQNANAFAERWVRKVRADCLDRILIVGRRHRRNPPGDDRDLHAADCDGRAAARQA
jgi:putative transposase